MRLGMVLAIVVLCAGSAQAQDTGPEMPAPPAMVEQPLIAPAAEVPAGVTVDAPEPAPDYSISGMIRAAHWVVKSVMGLLGAAVFATSTVLVYKMVELWLAARRLRRSAAVIAKAATLSDAVTTLAVERGPAAAMARAALGETQRSATLPGAGVKERVASYLQQMQAEAGQTLRKGTGLLATIGSTAPFVGLFGTVWGIMTSFVSIAETKTTNLAVVAPGIAEALLATAIGLIAAIPAVIIYNMLGRRIAALRQGLAGAASGIERLLSRDLDVGG